MGDVGPIDLDEARRVLDRPAADARVRAAGAALRPGVRRHAAAGARPQLPRGVRPGPRRADVPAEAARGSAAARRTARGGRSEPCARSRSGSRPNACCCSWRPARPRERLYVSYPRIELTESRARVPSFYALDVMRAATGRVPDYEWLEERARAGGQRHAGMARAAGARGRDRRSGARPGRAAAAARRARPRRGQGARALPAEAERVPAPLGGRPLGARRSALVGERRADPRVAPTRARARGTAAHRAPVFAFGAAAFQRVPVPVRARGRSTGCSRSSSRSRCSAWIR